MTAKEFLIANYANSAYAAKEDAKICLTIDEIAELLEKYAISLIKQVQVCPKCNGEGTVSNTGMMSTALFRDCPVCKGMRYFTI